MSLPSQLGVWTGGEEGTYTTGETCVVHLLYSLDNCTLSLEAAELKISEVPFIIHLTGSLNG